MRKGRLARASGLSCPQFLPATVSELTSVLTDPSVLVRFGEGGTTSSDDAEPPTSTGATACGAAVSVVGVGTPDLALVPEGAPAGGAPAEP